MCIRGDMWLKILNQRRFLSGFLCGVGFASASCLTALQLFKQKQTKQLESEQFAHVGGGDSAELTRKNQAEYYGLPVTGAEIRYYTNHALSYDQAKRVPRWVIEHITKDKTEGDADRRRCKFKPDPNVTPLFSAKNEDYIGSGWSRGHMAPAGDCKFSLDAMAETFYLSNIVPQNYENNAGFWNRLEMYCRELTQRFDDLWIVSGPLILPQVREDGKKTVTYQVIGSDDVAVPSHLYKVILARKTENSMEPLALAAFVVPNQPLGFDRLLPEFQVNLLDLEKMSGLTFFPKVDKEKSCHNLCEVDTCKLMTYKEFTLYITARKVLSARTLHRLEKVMTELKEAEIQPDDYLAKLYEKKRAELESKEQNENKERRLG